MKKNGRTLVLTLLAILVLVCAPLRVDADFGDFGGDSDYGGYDDYDSGYSYDDGYSGGGGSGGGTGTIADILVPGVITVFFILYTLNKGKRKGSKKGGAQPAGAARTAGLLPTDELYAWDSAFSADAVKRRLSNLYVQMQNCWTAMDLTPLRGDFTDEQFAQYDRQLDQYRGKGIINKIERISVLDVTLVGVQRQAETETLVAEIYARITTYTVKESTNEVIRGNPNEEKFMRYEWTLVRPRGTQTDTERKDEAFPCPQCGAPLNINQSAQCPYCQAIVRRADFDWVIAQIKGLSQQTR